MLVALTVDPPSGLLPAGDPGAGAGWDADFPPQVGPSPAVATLADAPDLPAKLRRFVDSRLHDHRRRLAAHHGVRALHTTVPGIADLVQFRHLADGLPTPVEDLGIEGAGLWVKRDDLSSSLYGGNKVRKLEYLLTRPARNESVVVTGGGTASHHVLATVLYGRLLGIDSAVALLAQPANPAIVPLRSLLDAYDVPVTYASQPAGYPGALLSVAVEVLRSGRRPHVIYPGGSTPAGILGYVDCGLEIAASVAAGDCPRPRAVYLPLGSGGSTVGIALGLAMGGVDTKVRAVRVADARANGRTVLGAMEAGTRALLALAGKPVGSALGMVEIVDSYFGGGYGTPTPEATAAAQTAARLGLAAETTYTAKAFAAALDAARQDPRGGPVLFVDTASGQDPLPL